MAILTIEEKLKIIEGSGSLGELPLDAMPYTQSDEYYFVSYSHRDYKEVYADILRLQAAGINIWYDRGLPAGKNWEDMAEEALSKHACVGVIFYLSENSLLSDAVQNEIRFVKNKGKDFLSVNLPIMFKDGNTAICSAEEMLEEISKRCEISEEKRKAVLSAFSKKVIYLGYNENTEFKVEKIRLLKRPELIEYDFIDDKEPYSVVKSVNSIEIKNVEIPAQIEKGATRYPVKKIDECAFANCKNLKTVKLNGKLDIGNSAFFGCTALEKIIGDKLGNLDERAFFGCTMLNQIPALDGQINTHAFYFCKNLHSVTLAHNFGSSKPGIFAFSGINQIIDRINTEESEVKRMGVKYKNGCITYLMVSSGFERLLLFAVPDENGTVTIPNGVHRILQGTLSSRDKIKHLRIPYSVRKIDGWAFTQCANLETVEFYSSDGNDAPDKSELIIEQYAFCGTKNLKNIIFPHFVKSIGNQAFKESGLQTVTFTENSKLEVLDFAAFGSCTNLREISLPNTLKDVNPFAFSGSVINTVHFSGTREQWHNLCPELKRVEISKIICRDGEITEHF